MANVASTALRRAARLGAKNASSASLIRTAVPRTSSLGLRYISETKSDAATVNVESAIEADQKKFFRETGKQLSEQPMAGTSVGADAMMDPMAGMLPLRHLDCT